MLRGEISHSLPHAKYVDMLRVINSSTVEKIIKTVTNEDIGLFFLARDSLLSALYAVVRPSICLSVRRVYHRKTIEVRIMNFSPYGNPDPLVFAG